MTVFVFALYMVVLSVDSDENIYQNSRTTICIAARPYKSPEPQRHLRRTYHTTENRRSNTSIYSLILHPQSSCLPHQTAAPPPSSRPPAKLAQSPIPSTPLSTALAPPAKAWLTSPTAAIPAATALSSSTSAPETPGATSTTPRPCAPNPGISARSGARRLRTRYRARDCRLDIAVPGVVSWGGCGMVN